MKFDKIQKFSVALKIWLKIESFDHLESAKNEIKQNPEIMSRVENLAENRFLTPPHLCRMKFGKIQKLWAVLKIWLKNQIFDHFRPAKEIWQNSEFSVPLKIWL